MSIIKDLEKDINELVKKAGYEEKEVILKNSDRRDLGEFQINDAMQLAKTYHKNPREIANDIVTELEKDDRFVNINIAGPGFINISLSDKFINESLNKMNEDINSNIDKKEHKKVVIDYGGANVSKALHVGHLRSANIGEALKRLARLMGYDAIGDAHLGDFGRPLGLVIKEIKEMYPDLPYFDENYTGDFSEVELPITNEDLERIYPLASNKSKEDEAYLEDARDITMKFQSKEKGYYELWKKIVDISKEDIKKTYDSLNTNFEIWNGESDEMEFFNELYKFYEEKGLITESEGAKVIDVSKEDDNAPMPPLMMVKTNGTMSYDSTDLAAILERKVNFNPDEMWYVVDGRQSLHFEQVFRVCKKSNLTKETVLEHNKFGTINGKDGKPFKTRNGEALKLDDLINDVKEIFVSKKETNKDMKPEDIDIIVNAIIKFADLQNNREKNYIFDIEKFADVNGKTGPYLLYTAVRIRKLINDHKGSLLKTTIYNKWDRDLRIKLLEVNEVVTKAADTRMPSYVADYLYDLAVIANTFYQNNNISNLEDEEIKNTWLSLLSYTYQVIEKLLNLLIIEIPSEM